MVVRRPRLVSVEPVLAGSITISLFQKFFCFLDRETQIIETKLVDLLSASQQRQWNGGIGPATQNQMHLRWQIADKPVHQFVNHPLCDDVVVIQKQMNGSGSAAIPLIRVVAIYSIGGNRSVLASAPVSWHASG